ncbi:dihydropteroate synthase [Sanguibacter antarcticus]|uniref:dihydropteroate synthase n=1 Tax=Sanguibacter antarcticus TaxID=372484 RepID=UPI003CCBAB1B
MRGDPVPPRAPALVLRGRAVGASSPAVMAIINRTTDSFFAGARQMDEDVALEAVARAVADGAEIVDVGGVRAGTGEPVTVSEEIRRTVPFVAHVREAFPQVLVSIDTWRSEVAREAVLAGADLINDTWAGHDPKVVEVAAETGAGIVCSHTGGAIPRTDPFRVAYPLSGDAPQGTDPRDGVVLDVIATLLRAAQRARACGVPPESILVDPTHDFGKNTWHSLHLVRSTQRLVELGYPLLMALSRKDFVGETLGLPAEERLEGTLAATALAAWMGASVFRAHDVLATRRVLDMVAAVRGDLAPLLAVRGME